MVPELFARMDVGNVHFNNRNRKGGYPVSEGPRGMSISTGIEDDGTDLMFGIGAQYMFTDQFGIVGEWEWYDIDNDVDLFSIGALIKF